MSTARSVLIGMTTVVLLATAACRNLDFDTACSSDPTKCDDYDAGGDAAADATLDGADTGDSGGGDSGDSAVDASGDVRDGCAPIACPATACGSLDDGCGGKLTCPDCPSGKTCDTTTHSCVCKPITACPIGLDCGKVPDGCGGTFDCLGCTGGKTCNTTTNKCETTCVPATSCPTGKCGDLDNGCGTGTLTCGCTLPQKCGGGGSPGVCGCTPTGSCGARVCGSVADGCGGAINCGPLGGGCASATPTCTAAGACVCTATSCPLGQTCNGSGVCVCSPSWSCTGKCGTITDTCGGTHDCGGCTAPATCGGGGSGTANVCSVCSWTSTYPPAGGCPSGDNYWQCWTPPALGGRTADFNVLTLCGDAVIQDTKTGLMWAQNEETRTTWANAKTECTASRRAGFSDWRVPTPVELQSIVDYLKTTAPAIDSKFQGVVVGSAPTNDDTWSSTLDPFSANGWAVDFYSGTAGAGDTGNPFAVRCVR